MFNYSQPSVVWVDKSGFVKHDNIDEAVDEAVDEEVYLRRFCVGCGIKYGIIVLPYHYREQTR